MTMANGYHITRSNDKQKNYKKQCILYTVYIHIARQSTLIRFSLVQIYLINSSAGLLSTSCLHYLTGAIKYLLFYVRSKFPKGVSILSYYFLHTSIIDGMQFKAIMSIIFRFLFAWIYKKQKQKTKNRGNTKPSISNGCLQSTAFILTTRRVSQLQMCLALLHLIRIYGNAIAKLLCRR